jgi:N-acetylglucosamine-6-phosphate deacetylase
MTDAYALAGARIFDGRRWHDDSALLVGGGSIDGIVPTGAVTDRPLRLVAGGMLAPGFIDLQVNGGGGALLNDAR